VTISLFQLLFPSYDGQNKFSEKGRQEKSTGARFRISVFGLMESNLPDPIVKTRTFLAADEGKAIMRIAARRSGYST